VQGGNRRDQHTQGSRWLSVVEGLADSSCVSRRKLCTTANAEFLVVRFVDNDGVEAGDQGNSVDITPVNLGKKGLAKARSGCYKMLGVDV